jgi:hypothetical protein
MTVGTPSVSKSVSAVNMPTAVRARHPSPTPEQNERMVLIRQALAGWNDSAKKLFEIPTWKKLITKAVNGTQQARRYKDDQRLSNFAKVIIEQISSPAFSGEVEQILCTRARNGSRRDGTRIAQEFMEHCALYASPCKRTRLISANSTDMTYEWILLSLGDSGMNDNGFDYSALVNDDGSGDGDLPKSEQEIARDYPKPPSCPDLKPIMFQELDEAVSNNLVSFSPCSDKLFSIEQN